MKHITMIFATALLIWSAVASAQEVKFGKVSQAELAQETYPGDPSAPAAVLYKKMRLFYEYRQGLGFSLVTELHERVKIYNQDGFEYATVSERLYKDGRDREDVVSLKAFTYNLVDGKVEKNKLEKSGHFKTGLNKYYDEEKFTMPNVKEGSIIEYQYRVNSPFYWSMDEIVLQYDIPIQYQEVSVAVPEYFNFKPSSKGYLPLSPTYDKTSGKINFTTKQRSGNKVTGTSYNNSTIDYTINKTIFTMREVPALKEEPYVNDMDNYRAAVNYELQFVKFPRSTLENYSTTWEKVVKTIYKSDNFGGQLESSRYFKDDLALLVQGKAGGPEKMMAIFQFVQQRMNWNGYNGFYADKGVKTAYNEKSGNTADINLMLTAMLREAGLDADPVLISTRDHGVPLFPTRKGFNYVICAVSLDGGLILLDASNKFTKPNLLRTNALNWFGKLIKEDGSISTVSVMPENTSRVNTICHMQLDPDGMITGKLRRTHSDYKAYGFRNSYVGIQEDSYLEKLESKNSGMEISAYNIKNDKTVGKPVMESYEFTMEDQISKVGDKMYFSPLFHNTMDENPFSLEERNYPIDFSYPWEERYMISITIPEGYQVEALPEETSLALPNNYGSFRYKIVQQGKMLQLMVNLKMNKAVIPATEYPLVKELYKKVVEKETEKVVLTKNGANGDQDGTSGGR